MRRETLPSSLLAPWARLNGVVMNGVRIDHRADGRGYSLVAERDIPDAAAAPLLMVPGDLVLSAEAVRGQARFDGHLKQLLDVAPELAEVHS